MSKKSEPVITIPADELPNGWSLASIADLVGSDGVFVDGDWVESKDQDPNGDVRLIQLADVGDGSYRDKSSRFLTQQKAVELNCTFLDRGDVLIARMPDPLGRACIFPGDTKNAVTVVDVAVVRSGNDSFSHRWLMHFVNAPAFRSVVASLQSGSTRKRISRKNLARIMLPVPPREQQDEIVAEIEKQFSRLDEAVANLKRVKANLKRYKAAVLKAAVEGKLTEEWRKAHPDVEPASKLLDRILAERRAKWEEAELAKMEAKGKVPKNDKWKAKYKEPIAPDTSRLSELPESWVWSTVDQLVAHLTDGDHQPPPQTDQGIPFLVIGNVRNGEVDFSKTRYVGKEYYAMLDPFRRPQLGDLLYTLVGSYGIPVRVRTEKPFCIQRHMAILRPHGKSPMDYLAVAMASNNVFNQATAVATGTAQKTVPLAGLRRILIALPPADEQALIVTEVDRHLSLIRETETQVDTNLRRASRLRQSLLQQAFHPREVA